MQENLEVFELNNKVLDDFDNLMKKHLDKIRVLKIYDDIKNAKLFNIIGLCLNILELHVEGNQKTDINKIISSISNPEKIQKISFNNIKLPTIKSFSKFKNLRSVELKNIKFSKVEEFFESIVSKELIEELIVENVDFMNSSFEIFSNFRNLKKINTKNLMNIKFKGMGFLLESKKIQEIYLKGNKISFTELRALSKGKYKKDIELNFESKTNFRNSIKIKDKIISIVVAAEDVKELVKNINFSLVNDIQIIFEEQTSFIEFIRVLKKVENDISICLKEVSKLTKEEIIILRDVLKVKKISIINEENKITNTYDIDDFIKIREAIENFIEQIPKEIPVQEKFLWIYKVLLKNIKYEESKQENEEDDIERGLLDNKCISKGYAFILKNCLNCLNIESAIVKGQNGKEKQEWFWVQVKLAEKWYNADLALDAKLNKKMKNCLISNESISKKHEFNSNKTNYCVEDFDYYLIQQFWKNDKILQEEKNSIIKNIIDKLKLLFASTKGLPEPSNKEEKNDNT